MNQRQRRLRFSNFSKQAVTKKMIGRVCREVFSDLYTLLFCAYGLTMLISERVSDQNYVNTVCDIASACDDCVAAHAFR